MPLIKSKSFPKPLNTVRTHSLQLTKSASFSSFTTQINTVVTPRIDESSESSSDEEANYYDSLIKKDDDAEGASRRKFHPSRSPYWEQIISTEQNVAAAAAKNSAQYHLPRKDRLEKLLHDLFLAQQELLLAPTTQNLALQNEINELLETLKIEIRNEDSRNDLQNILNDLIARQEEIKQQEDGSASKSLENQIELLLTLLSSPESND